eukprot:CAMPEP_0171119234 /NCGR_PEP_ID=MMETSP0766_2-20121228/96713_1 /TAXON_ID=439317 /ORGANISM="Gambierdiscus australes, Strain CAWD 149" /LENGTH=66 /DNA_ID=CAMNT_0011581881 /DNA_START=94 /DNA_END=290 /DNA_ORIENTATION=-
MKPWRREKWGKTQLPPLCSVPSRIAAAAGQVREAGGMQFAECANLWWAYLSEPAAQAVNLRNSSLS